MTFEQAKQLLASDRERIEQAQSDLRTVRHLFAIGEDEKAVNLFASVRRRMSRNLGQDPQVVPDRQA